MFILRKFIGLGISTAVLTLPAAQAYSKEAAIAPLPAPSGISCENAINQVTADLAKRGYFIPWRISKPAPKLIQPKVIRDQDSIREGYIGYPPGRPEAVVLSLSGDSTKLYVGLMSSPQLMANIGAKIMSACDQVGLVEFVHWWEGYVPVGYFSDNTARTFQQIDFRDPSRTRTVETSHGSTTQYQWGFYSSP
jgi:hypothetical protein